MTAYLLDTNTCVEILRNRNAGIVAKFRASDPIDLRLCSTGIVDLRQHTKQAQQ